MFFISGLLSGQVSFNAKTSKKRLGINERLRIDFTMNKDGDEFEPPEFKNFSVVGGPSQSINNSWINGVRSFSKTYSYFLAPKKRGNFTIGQATIEIDGETFKTLPVTQQLLNSTVVCAGAISIILVVSCIGSPLLASGAATIVSNITATIHSAENRPFMANPRAIIYMSV